jgi:hypothetical protein
MYKAKLLFYLLSLNLYSSLQEVNMFIASLCKSRIILSKGQFLVNGIFGEI